MTNNEPQPRLTGRSASYRTNDLRDFVSQIFSNERLIVSIALGVLATFSVLDFIEDRGAGANTGALWSDVSDAFLPVLLLIYIWRFKPLSQLRRANRLESDLINKSADLQHWQEKAGHYIKGLSESIDEQLNLWKLTRAEKEVALLLLKGFSLRELADMRGTSERTVRQQATRIYEKAGLRGRAELSAFFLEDLMLPVEVTKVINK